MSFIQSVS